MKRKSFKTSIGIVAVSALVGMNLFHAWNNYGIKDSSMLLSVKATPADTTSVKCETKPGGGPVVAHKKAITDEKTKECPIQHVLIYYGLDQRGSKYIVAYEYIDIATGKTLDIKFTDGRCELTDFYVEAGKDIMKEFELVKITCDKKIDKTQCCYPHTPEEDCNILIKGTI